MEKSIVLVDDEPNMLKVLSAILKKIAREIICCNNAAEALNLLEQKKTCDLLISDLKMPGIDGIELLRISRERYPDIPVIIMTAHGTIETAVEAMKIGAFDYIIKPFDMEEIKLRVQSALNATNFLKQEIKLTSNVKKEVNLKKIIGNSQPMQEIFSIMKRVAAADSSILITGESGTGKELIARDIHNMSTRKKFPFIAINCAAIPEALLESELFGHEKGAFTGASERRKGRFELAENGTLFLDEIGDMNLSMQVKLLRVLQEKTFERLGSSEPIEFKARIISAANRDLSLMQKEGKFRSDLYYRINVIPIDVPALRQRKEDIEGLIDYFMDCFSKKLDCPQVNLSSQVKDCLFNYDWPGNIRELENTIEYLLVMKNKTDINIEDLPEKFIGKFKKIQNNKALLKNLAQIKEKEIIIHYLAEYDNNRTRTAEALGINRRTLLNKIKEYGLS